MKRGQIETVACRTPTAGRSGVTHIPRWKYEAVREAIQRAMSPQTGVSISFNELRLLAKTHMSEAELASLGSWGWHFTTVKLNMEVEGELKRIEGVKPQQLILVYDNRV